MFDLKMPPARVAFCQPFKADNIRPYNHYPTAFENKRSFDKTNHTHTKWCGYDDLEQVTGVEPASKAWEAFILPMNYTCILL